MLYKATLSCVTLIDPNLCPCYVRVADVGCLHGEGTWLRGSGAVWHRRRLEINKSTSLADPGITLAGEQVGLSGKLGPRGVNQ